MELSFNTLPRATAMPGLHCAPAWLRQWSGSSRRYLRVLTYQRVAEECEQDDLDPATISATPFAFCKQMQLLATRFRVIRLDDALATSRGSVELPANAVVVTFDGAYRDFQEHAWPVMRHLGLPATLFVPTAYPDEPRRHLWWDQLYRDIRHSTDGTELSLPWGRVILHKSHRRLLTFRRLKGRIRRMPHVEAMRLLDQIHTQADVPAPPDNGVLSWDELRRLHSEGVTLAPHTRTHPLLNRIPHKQARRGGRQILERPRSAHRSGRSTGPRLSVRRSRQPRGVADGRCRN